MSFSQYFASRISPILTMASRSSEMKVHDNILESPEVWPDKETAHLMSRAKTSTEREKMSEEEKKKEDERLKKKRKVQEQLEMIKTIQKSLDIL